MDEIESLKLADGYHAYELSSIKKVLKASTQEEVPTIKVNIEESIITKKNGIRYKDKGIYNTTYEFSKENEIWKISSVSISQD